MLKKWEKNYKDKLKQIIHIFKIKNVIEIESFPCNLYFLESTVLKIV